MISSEYLILLDLSAGGVGNEDSNVQRHLVF